MIGKFKGTVVANQRAHVTTLQVSAVRQDEDNRTQILANWSAAQAWFLANATREGQSPLSVLTRGQRIRLFAAHCEAQAVTPDQVNQSHIKAYVDKCLKEKLSHFTVNGRLRVIKTFFAEGVAEGLFTVNPATGVKKLREATNTVVPLSAVQVSALLKIFNKTDWVELRDSTIVSLFLDTGLRIQEGLQSRVDDLKLSEGALFIPPEHGKGNKARTVYFGKQTAAALSFWLAKRGVETPILFPGVYVDASGNYGSLTTRAFAKRLTKYGTKAGIKHIHPHMLRLFMVAPLFFGSSSPSMIVPSTTMVVNFNKIASLPSRVGG